MSGSPATSACTGRRDPRPHVNREPGRPRRGREADHQQRGLCRHGREDVVVSMVRQLVRQHDLDLVVGIVGDERVREEDAACSPHAYERGIGTTRLFAERPLIDAECRQAGACRQRAQPLLQRRPVEWPETIEQRKKCNRRQMREQQDREAKSNRGHQPPLIGPPSNRVIEELGAGNRQRHEDERSLSLIAQPGRCCLLCQAVSPFENDATVVGDGEANDLPQCAQHEHVERYGTRSRLCAG